MSSRNQIDVHLFTDKTNFMRLKVLRMRAIYMNVDHEIVVRCEGEFRRVYLLPDGLFSCFISDAVFLERNCRRVPVSEIEDGSVSLSTQCPNLFALQGLAGEEKAWVTQNSLGTYLYFNGSENQFTELLVDLHTAKIPKIISWEDGCFAEVVNGLQFNWRAKFAPSLNLYSLYRRIFDILRYLPDDLEGSAISKFAEQGSNAANAFQLNHRPEDLEEVVTSAQGIGNERVSTTEKFIRSSMFYLLPNIALHPNVSRLLSKDVDDVGPLFTLLEQIDRGERVPFKKIAASAGGVGWREINNHISNGRNKNLRIYFRKNTKSEHRLDVFVENKTTNIAQNKTFERLAKMNFFESREVIFQ